MPNKNSQEPMKLWYEYIWLTIGVLLVAAGVYFFKFPNNYSIGGVTGLAILFSKITNGALSSGTIVLWVNMALLVVGYFVLGKGAGFKTAYGSILLSAALKILEKIFTYKCMRTIIKLYRTFEIIFLSYIAYKLFNY